MPTLVERLGYRADARLLVIDCDELGLSQAANTGCLEALRAGLATSASLMVPCPWAREAAARYRGEDVGVHLTVNAEWDLYRWAPLTQAPSLLDGDGGFPRTPQEVWDHADVDEVRRELRTQIERAILWGFDVSHLDAHLDTLLLRPEFFDVVVELAAEFGLPIRLPDAHAEASAGFPLRGLAAEAGVLGPDHVLPVGRRGTRRTLEAALFDLRPGVTAVSAVPAVDTPELRALAADWPRRVADHHALVHDADLRAMAERSGVVLVGYRPLRELQRRG